MAQKSTSAATAAPISSTSGLLDQIMAQTRIEPSHEGYAVAERGVAAFIAEMLKTGEHEQPVNKQLVDQMIAEIDRKLSHQMDAILHQRALQDLESAWRGLQLLVDRTDFRENIRIEILHVTKDELLEDFEGSADITRSGLYKHVYTAGYLHRGCAVSTSPSRGK